MVGINTVDVFNTKIINNQRESEWTGVVLPKAWRDRDRGITEGRKELGQAIVGDFSGLREAIHAFANFNLDIVIVNEVSEFVFFKNSIRDAPDWDAHVLVIVYGRF